MSELALIERIAARTVRRPGTEVAIGDDAALIDLGPRAVLTQDLLVDGVHFRRSTTGMADLGHKALAVNLSDLAAMGAWPVAALIGLGLPADGPADDEIEALYEGIEALAAHHGVTVAGGDVTSAPALLLAVTAAGRLPQGVGAPLRSGGREGDLLCVTGGLGAGAAGLMLLERPELGAGLDPALADGLRDAQRRPEPRLAAGRALAAAGVHALMDVSDGLALDALRLARASGLRATIELDALPLAAGVRELAAAAGSDPLELAASGGDDYELLAALPSELVERLAGEIDPPLSPVGRLERGEPGLRALVGGAEVALESPGWEHRV